MRKRVFQIVMGMITWFSITSAYAYSIGSYGLQTKSSGDEIPFMFGFLRDGSLGAPTKEYTADFDFVHNDMTLTNDGEKIFIDGQVHAGNDDGQKKTVLKSWDLNFVYDITDVDHDDVDLHLMSDTHDGLKAFLKDFRITDVSGLPFMLMQDKIDHVIGKMGVMKHGTTCKTAFCKKWQYKDWAFSIKHPAPEPVPVPAPIWLLSSGLFALVAVARRAAKQN